MHDQLVCTSMHKMQESAGHGKARTDTHFTSACVSACACVHVRLCVRVRAHVPVWPGGGQTTGRHTPAYDPKHAGRWDGPSTAHFNPLHCILHTATCEHPSSPARERCVGWLLAPAPAAMRHASAALCSSLRADRPASPHPRPPRAHLHASCRTLPAPAGGARQHTHAGCGWYGDHLLTLPWDFGCGRPGGQGAEQLAGCDPFEGCHHGQVTAASHATLGLETAGGLA